MRRGARTPCGRGCARVVPARTGILILDATSFPKQGERLGRRHPAVLRRAREDCQLPGGGDGGAVDRRRGVAVGGDHVSARDVVDAGAADEGRIPATVKFQPKWQLALTLLRQVRAAGFELTAVVGDAEFGDKRHAPTRVAPRAAAVRVGRVSRSDGVSRHADAAAAPAVVVGHGAAARRARVAARDTTTIEARAGRPPRSPRQWRLVSWRNGTNPPWRARFCAVRVTPAHDWRERRLAPEVWLLCERDLGADAADQVLPGRTCHRPRRSARWCGSRISAGRSSSNTKN